MSKGKSIDTASHTRRGGSFYDDAEVFARYRQPRTTVSDPTEVMEHPALMAEIGSVEGLRIADLGCGDAAIGRALLAAGCRCYLGVDGSINMVREAQATLEGAAATIAHQDIEDFRPPADSFDLVISRLAMHYVEDLDAVLRACAAGLSFGGRVIFTVVHPTISCHDARPSTNELRTHWIVDDYFVRGPREQGWLGGEVIWHHRTIEDYVAAFQAAGLTLTGLRECAPHEDLFDDHAEYLRRRRIPMFLLVAGTKMEAGRWPRND